MAKADINFPDAFLEQLSRLGNQFDSVAESVLEAGGEVVLAKAQRNLATVVGTGTKYDSRSTGELVDSLGLSPVKLNKSGNHDIKVGFSEPRSDGSSNAKIANILEYGKHGQAPKPFMKPAKTSSKAVCIQVMKDTLEAEVKKL
ncbi:MAG: HK97 gp10 family phage protein [Oscillospiraceae bacterium]|nr:HK97 gp10 family phage protein [Oscillospiraceae bacterium]